MESADAVPVVLLPIHRRIRASAHGSDNLIFGWMQPGTAHGQRTTRRSADYFASGRVKTFASPMQPLRRMNHAVGMWMASPHQTMDDFILRTGSIKRLHRREASVVKPIAHQ
jgi:hypothetical protein